MNTASISNILETARASACSTSRRPVTVSPARDVTSAYKVAFAAAWDAGNQHMREHGRCVWNADDYAHAANTFNLIYQVQS